MVGSIVLVRSFHHLPVQLILGITVFWSSVLGVMGLILAAIRIRRMRHIADTALPRALIRSSTEAFVRENPAKVHSLLATAVEDVAREQDLPSTLVRAAVFRLDPDQRLRIVDGMTFQIRDLEERSIEIAPGEGAAGECFSTGEPRIVVFSDAMEDSTIGDEKEREKIDPDLKWIISVPIAGGPATAPIGVFNVDGLVLARKPELLARSIPTLLRWSEVLSIFLREVFLREVAVERSQPR